MRVDAVEFRDELLDRARRFFRDLTDAVLVAKQVCDLCIENLPCKVARLLHDLGAVFRIRVVAKVRAFVDEALTVCVDHDAERVGVFLELIADSEIAELGRVLIPADCMTAGPVTVRCCADVERHADSVTRVEARPADFGDLPARAEITRAPLGVGFEATCGDHDGFCLDRLGCAARTPDDDTRNVATVRRKPRNARFVLDSDAAARAALRQTVDEARSTADRLDRESTPELELAIDFERLAAIDRDEAHAFVAHPEHRCLGTPHEQLDEIRVAAKLRDAIHVVEELVFVVGAEVRHCHVVIAQIWHETLEILDAVIGEAKRAGREAAVAAALVLGRALENEHAGAVLLGGQRGTECGVAATHDNDVVDRHVLGSPPSVAPTTDRPPIVAALGWSWPVVHDVDTLSEAVMGRPNGDVWRAF